MKILIVSDTHGRLENLERVIEMTKPIDALIHLGDVEGQEDYILPSGSVCSLYGQWKQ